MKRHFSSLNLLALCTCLGLGSLVLLPTAAADTLEIQAFDDSYIRASQGNEGANSLFLVGDTAGTSDYLRGVLAFNMSNPLLTGATINSVTLTLRVNSVDTGASDSLVQTLEVHALSAAFSEGSVTWVNSSTGTPWTNPGGDFGPTLASLNAIAKGTGGVTVNQDLTFAGASLTANAAGAVGGNYYLLVKLATEDASRSIFRFSADNGGTSGFTTLNIDYTPVPEPGSAALLLGAVALALIGIRRRR